MIRNSWNVGKIPRMCKQCVPGLLFRGRPGNEAKQGVAQGCSLSPILFSVFINGLVVAVEQAGLGIELGDGGRVGGLLFADDFVGVSESGEQLQRVIDVVHSYCRKWRLKANVSKSAVMTFGKGSVEGSCK